MENLITQFDRAIEANAYQKIKLKPTFKCKIESLHDNPWSSIKRICYDYSLPALEMKTAWGRQIRKCFCFGSCRKNRGLHIYSEESGRKLRLTAKQCSTIDQSWKDVRNKEALAEEVFKRVLLSNDKIRTIFDLHTCPDDQLTANETFKRHLKSLSLFLSICAASVTVDADRLTNIARRIGEKHVNFRWVTFDAEYWLLMKNVMVEVISSYQKPKNVVRVCNAWNVLLCFVISEIKHSFMAALNTRHTRQADDMNTKTALMQKLQDEWDLMRQHRDNIPQQ